MKNNRAVFLIRLSVMVLFALPFTLVYAQSGRPPGGGISPAPAWSGKQLVAPPTDGWPTNGGNVYNQRYSPLTQITTDNVAGLRAVWRARLGGSGVGPEYSGEAQPIVHGGTLYTITGEDDVFAISVSTGEILWRYEAGLDPAISTVCCGWTSRGVGIGAGLVYVGQLDGKLVALDQQTGELVWSVQAERWQDGFSITGAPLYTDGLVITGFAGAEYGVRGRVKAFDAVDGSLVWTFFTIPGPGEVGHDTWPDDNNVWEHGGASVWQTPAVDPELGLVYFSTGNPGPDFNGSVRAGDNLFATSIVAIELATGEYRWHFQQVHHDIWDYDGPSPVVLFDLELDGRLRRGLAEPSKTGWVYILDRETGEPLIGIEERPVPQEPRQATAATQPYPVGDAFVPQSIPIPPEGYRLINDGRIFTPFYTESRPIKPGPGGGANWPPGSYDPLSGYLYVCAMDRAGVYTAGDLDNEIPARGERYVGGTFGTVEFGETGIFTALDMHTNRIVWQQQWPERCYSGSAVTASGLVFVGRGDGRMTALDAADGTRLWEFQTGAGVNAPPTVFEHDGTQYVAVYSGGSRFANTPRGDSIWLFSLDGTLDPVEPAVAASAAAPAGDTEPDFAAGQVTYESICAFCHGVAGEGGAGGGSALTGATDSSTVTEVVRFGRNQMPPFEGVLSGAEIRDVVGYVTRGLGR
jgi:quinohemoprotein ethanol dehydrogenase